MVSCSISRSASQYQPDGTWKGFIGYFSREMLMTGPPTMHAMRQSELCGVGGGWAWQREGGGTGRWTHVMALAPMWREGR